MPAGMQCWDASGKLVVDIGDYNTRYLGRTTATMAANTNQLTGSFSGLTANGSFAVVASVSGTNLTPPQFATRVYDGGYRVFKLSRFTAAATLTLDLYAFL